MLPKGITGFGDRHDPPPSAQDSRLFLQRCHTIARENGGVVCAADCDIAARSFYWAQLRWNAPGQFLLQNAYFPYLAFAETIADGRVVFTDPPPGLRLSDPDLRVLSRAALAQDAQTVTAALGRAEREQIAYWRPRTAGEIVFHFWD